MKKIFTLALSISLSSSIFAVAEFFVKITSNGNYTVSLNNQTITTTSNTFRFFDLNAGNYNLKVFENGFNNHIVFSQNVFIQNGFRIVAELNTRTGLRIIDKLAFVQKSWYIDNIITNQNPPVCEIPIPSCPKPITPKPNCNNDYNYGQGWNGYGYGNNYPDYPNTGGNYGYNNGNILDDATLQSIKQTMKNATFDAKMLETGKTALKTRMLKTNQVHQLLELFSFETNKLEFAKYCYEKTIDKNNYYTLYNDFTFSSYSSQLDKFINSR